MNYSTSPTLSPLSVKSETGGTVTNHSTALTGLTASTRYYYRIFQVAPNGQQPPLQPAVLRDHVSTA